VPPYTDNLNSWLGQILQRDAPQIMVEIVDVETTGMYIDILQYIDKLAALSDCVPAWEGYDFLG
jgi:hypothetical protein